jgi:hypothetical protein
VTKLEPGSFGLMPLLHERLSQVVPDEPQLSRLAGTYRSIWYRNRMLLERLTKLLALLREEEVNALLVGGAALVLRWYARLGLRPVMELELAVEPTSLEHTVAVAGRAGWQRGGQPRPFVRLHNSDGGALVIHPGPPPSVAGPAGRDGSYRIFRARAAELTTVESRPLVLDSGDEFLFVCALGARTVTPPSCQWLVDAHEILRSGQLPPVEELMARAKRFRVLEPVRATIVFLAELLGHEGLEEHLAALNAQPAARRDRVAFGLAGTRQGRAVGPAQTLAVHLQATADEPRRYLVTRVPRTLKENWGTRSLLETSALALRKTARILGPEGQPGASERSRSASS